jgi:hypothetical protein
MNTYLAGSLLFATLIIVAFMLGYTRGKASQQSNVVGIFEINHTNPTKDLCNLILDKDLDFIEQHKDITFVVKIADDKGV